MKDYTKHNKPYVCVAAVVGLSGLQEIVYNVIVKVTGRKIATFPYVEAAKDFLVGYLGVIASRFPAARASSLARAPHRRRSTRSDDGGHERPVNFEPPLIPSQRGFPSRRHLRGRCPDALG